MTSYFKATKNNLEIVRKTKGDIPNLPFVALKKQILNDSYELSISFIGSADMEQLSREYKKSPHHKNILSFPYGHNAGEIVMNLQSIRLEAKKYDRTYSEHLLFLIIHGMLHLTGLDHGPKMEKLENKFMEFFTQ